MKAGNLEDEGASSCDLEGSQFVGRELVERDAEQTLQDGAVAQEPRQEADEKPDRLSLELLFREQLRSLVKEVAAEALGAE